jgi:formate dehydrogenase subunit gamma
MDLRAVVAAAVAEHAGARGPLLPVLHDLQAAVGYIPAEAVGLLAEELNLSRADVHGVVSFYSDFRDRPGARRTVRICAAEGCQARGAEELTEKARESLGIDFGEISDDGAVELDEVFCLGLCAQGPAVEVDGVPYGRMNPQDLPTLVAQRR